MASDGNGSPDPLQRLSAVSAKVTALVAEAVADWAPEAPPPTLVLGDIGLLLINRCDEFDDAELSAILGVVEDVLASGTAREQDAVATGLLEAALHVGDRHPTPLARVMAFAGPESRAYCAAWNEFCGVGTNPNPRERP
jgi:hypothetical protein